jgi:hypothetical protein
MCTIIVVNHHHKDFPLLIAANRDEDQKRPSSPVQILAREPHLIVGGKDELKGGTWLGVNKNSLFVAITNQNTTNTKLESRGQIVLNALKCSTLGELIAFMEGLNPTKYNSFNIVFGNHRRMFLGHSYILHSMVMKELPAGIHIINSDMKFSGENNKNAFIHKMLDEVKTKPWLEYYKLLKKILASSEYGIKLKPKKSKDGKIDKHCTKSSSILAFSDEGLVRYKFHDRTVARPKRKEGEPFVPRYKDYIDLWRNPDNLPSMPIEHSEESDDGEDEVERKDEVKDVFEKLKMRENKEYLMKELLKIKRESDLDDD